jgi:hypothetical protein
MPASFDHAVVIAVALVIAITIWLRYFRDDVFNGRWSLWAILTLTLAVAIGLQFALVLLRIWP